MSNIPTDSTPSYKATYCVKCGADLQGAILFCPSCGKEVVHPSIRSQDRPKRKLNPKTKKLLISLIPVCVVLAILLTLFFSSGSSTPKGAIDKYFELANGNLLLIETSAPASFWLNYATEEDITYREAIEQHTTYYLANAMEVYEQYGSYSYSYTILEEYDFTEDELKALMGRSLYRISDARRYRVAVAIRGEKATNSDIYTFTVVQSFGRWYMLGFASLPVIR